jgi:hypothetical protein
MRVRWPLLGTFAGLAACYIAYPYITLYRLGMAVHHADARTLQRLVDWPAVREGIKEDVCDQAAEASVATSPDQLPAFGASFVRGIANTAIDRAVTPEGLVAAISTPPTVSTPPAVVPAGPWGISVHVQWAFFVTPTTFDVSLKTPETRQPIRLQLELHDARWRVTRVRLPPQMLDPANSRT